MNNLLQYMKSTIGAILLIIFFQVFLLGCTRNYETVTSEIVFKDILEKCTSKDTNVIYQLDSLLPFKWDRMMVIEPYWSEATLKQCGVDTKLPGSKIRVTEGSNEFIFIKDGTLIKHIIHSSEEKRPINLVLDYPLDNSKSSVCGIENSPGIYIRFAGDSSYNFLGKTFIVFKK